MSDWQFKWSVSVQAQPGRPVTVTNYDAPWMVIWNLWFVTP